jgi:predicted transporter
MNNKKISTHMIFTGIYFVLAVLTLIPAASASKLSMLGYKALCTFTPISTIILIALGGLHIFLQRRSAVKE